MVCPGEELREVVLATEQKSLKLVTGLMSEGTGGRSQ